MFQINTVPFCDYVVSFSQLETFTVPEAAEQEEDNNTGRTKSQRAEFLSFLGNRITGDRHHMVPLSFTFVF